MEKIACTISCILDSLYLWQPQNRTSYLRLLSQSCKSWTKSQVISVVFLIAYISLAASEPYFLFAAAQSALSAMEKIACTISCILDSLYLWQPQNRTSYLRLLGQSCKSWTKSQVISVVFLIAYISLAASEPYFLSSAAQSAKLALDKIPGNISCILDSLCISGSLRNRTSCFGFSVSPVSHGRNCM